MASVQWQENGLYTNDTSLLPDRLSSACELAITKPVNGRAMEAIYRLLERRREVNPNPRSPHSHSDSTPGHDPDP